MMQKMMSSNDAELTSMQNIEEEVFDLVQYKEYRKKKIMEQESTGCSYIANWICNIGTSLRNMIISQKSIEEDDEDLLEDLFYTNNYNKL